MIRKVPLLSACAMLFVGLKLASADTCTVDATAGVDTSAIYDHIPAFFGRAPGQTFLATDTLIASLTVWRVPLNGPNGSPMKLWITKTDSTGVPLTLEVVVDGPVLVVPTDELGVPIEVRFEWAKPVALPGPGRYAFFVQQYLCDGTFDLYTALDLYPGGNLWHTYRGIPECELRTYPQNWPEDDLVFSIEFCSDTSTPTLRKSWGQVKVRYK